MGMKWAEFADKVSTYAGAKNTDQAAKEKKKLEEAKKKAQAEAMKKATEKRKAARRAKEKRTRKSTLWKTAGQIAAEGVED